MRYPVALDNDFATWRAYGNEYWPADYLVDRSGRIRDEHFGEGPYDETGTAIRKLLGERAVPRTSVADTTPRHLTTPESYLGYARLDRFPNETPTLDAPHEYRFPRTLPLDHLAYAGTWTVEPSRIVAGRGAKLRLRFRANDVFLVLAGTGEVEVLVDGVQVRTLTVSGTPRLYTLAQLGS